MLPNSSHGDDNPVKCSGDVSEAWVILHLNVVGEAGKDEARDDEDHDQEAKLRNALAQGEHYGLQALRMSC